MLGVFVSVLQLVAVANAFLRSAQARFIAGAGAAILRALLIVAGIAGVLWARTVHAPGTETATPGGAALLAAAATFLGPVVSFRRALARASTEEGRTGCARAARCSA
jgi:hypothetical protein